MDAASRRLTCLWLYFLNFILNASYAAVDLNKTASSFHDHRVLRLSPQIHVRHPSQGLGTLENLQTFIEDLSDKYYRDIIVWRDFDDARQYADIQVSPNVMSDVYAESKKRNFRVQIIIDDVQRLIDREKHDMDKRSRKVRCTSCSNILGEHAKYDEIAFWGKLMERNHPGVFQMESIGKTYENRDLYLFKLAKNNYENKPAIFIEAGIHGREWVSPAVAIYIAHKLMNDSDHEAKTWLDTLDWYIVPVTNPDGYEYTHSEHRLWRQNRKPIGKNSEGGDCFGVDLNRNWGYKWNLHGFCSQVYSGPEPESELEVKAMARFIKRKMHSIAAYLSIHSYSQVVLSRWDHSIEILPPLNHSEHQFQVEVAHKMAKSMSAVYGTHYISGNALETLGYLIKGSSTDWAAAVAKIRFSYCVELRDKGQYGFLLPKDQIIPNAEEFWAGLREIVRAVWIQQKQSKVAPVTSSVLKLRSIKNFILLLIIIQYFNVIC